VEVGIEREAPDTSASNNGFGSRMLMRYEFDDDYRLMSRAACERDWVV